MALLLLDSPCQVHPLIARIWSARLRGKVVIAANRGYLPGRVNFAVRSAGGEDLIGFLKSLGISPGEGTYAGGHDRATGGSLPPERWGDFLRALGLAEKVATEITL